MRWWRALALSALGLCGGASMGAFVGVVMGGPLGVAGWPVGAVGGGAVGAVAAALLLASRARLGVVVAALVVAPLGALACGQSGGQGDLASALGGLAAFLALPVTLVAFASGGWRALRWNLLTCAVAAYAFFALVGAWIGGAQRATAGATPALGAIAVSVAPVAFFFLGSVAPEMVRRASPRQRAPLWRIPQRATRGLRWLISAQPDGDQDDGGALIQRLGWLVMAAGGALAALAVARGASIGAQPLAGQLAPPAALPPPYPPGAPAATTLADALGVLLTLGLTWDTPRRLALLTLGAARWPLKLALLIGAALYFGVTLWGLLATGAAGILVATSVALLGVALARQRLGRLALLPLAGFPLLGIALARPARGGWPSQTLAQPFSGPESLNAWRPALDLAATHPLGAGLGAPVGATASGLPLYPATLYALGVPGLTALLFVLGVALVQLWRGYRLLRPTSGLAGTLLTAGALTLFVVVAGLLTNPLSEPVIGMLFWLFLGLANAVLERIARAREERGGAGAPELAGALRAYPLRVAYVVDGADESEFPAALFEYFQAVDRRRVTPLVIARGAGPLTRAIGGLTVASRVAPRRVPGATRARRSLGGRVPLLRAPVFADLFDVWGRALEFLALTRAALELNPDLLVSARSDLHVVTLCVGRCVGTPVQWWTHDIAPRRLRHALDGLAPWTASALATSQAAARAFDLRRLGSQVRVLRPGVEPPRPLTSEAKAALRAALGVERAAPIITYLGPLTAQSGHQDLLDAVPLLRERFPGLRVLLASEALPGEGAHEAASASEPWAVRERRLQYTTQLRGLGGIVSFLGKRLDASDLLAISDLAVFPLHEAAASRALLLAMGQGVPIVASNVDALPELLAEAWGHELFPPGDVAALAQAMTRVLSRLDAYRADARRNPGLVRDWFALRMKLGRLSVIQSQLALPDAARASAQRDKRRAQRPRWIGSPWMRRLMETRA